MIAHELVVSESTVDFHIRDVLEKLGARNRSRRSKRADMLGIQMHFFLSRSLLDKSAACPAHYSHAGRALSEVADA